LPLLLLLLLRLLLLLLLVPTGGNMVAFVTKRRETREARGGLCIDEDEASFFFRQLVWAVQFCHKNHVAHRWVWCLVAGSLFIFSCLC
jgi:serine/threonine-protein kinase SRK2